MEIRLSEMSFGPEKTQVDVNYPARQNHRIIPTAINDTPGDLGILRMYIINEHCIVFNCQHTPNENQREMHSLNCLIL